MREPTLLAGVPARVVFHSRVPGDGLLIGWWPGTESNRRRQPFQGCALPSELPGHPLGKTVPALPRRTPWSAARAAVTEGKGESKAIITMAREIAQRAGIARRSADHRSETVLLRLTPRAAPSTGTPGREETRRQAPRATTRQCHERVRRYACPRTSPASRVDLQRFAPNQ